MSSLELALIRERFNENLDEKVVADSNLNDSINTEIPAASSNCFKRQHSSNDLIKECNTITKNPRELIRKSFGKSIQSTVDGLMTHFRCYTHDIGRIKENNEVFRVRLKKLEEMTISLSPSMHEQPETLATTNANENTQFLPPLLSPPLVSPRDIISTGCITETDTNSPAVIIPITADSKSAPILPTKTKLPSPLKLISEISSFRNHVIDLTAEPPPLSPFSTGVPQDSLKSLVSSIPVSGNVNANQSTLSYQNEPLSILSAPFIPPPRPIDKLPIANGLEKNNNRNLSTTANTTELLTYLNVDSPQHVDIAPLPELHQATMRILNTDFSTIRPIQPLLILVIFPATEGVSLRWELHPTLSLFEPAVLYELYSYASSDIDDCGLLTSDIWQKVGEVDALPLPMMCTLTSIVSNNIYYFIVRSRDKYGRLSAWSNVVTANVI